MLDHKKCVANNLDIESMSATYTEILGLSEDETLILAWIVYESREERNWINKAVIKDPRIEEMEKLVETWPFAYYSAGLRSWSTLEPCGVR